MPIFFVALAAIGVFFVVTAKKAAAAQPQPKPKGPLDTDTGAGALGTAAGAAGLGSAIPGIGGAIAGAIGGVLGAIGGIVEQNKKNDAEVLAFWRLMPLDRRPAFKAYIDPPHILPEGTDINTETKGALQAAFAYPRTGASAGAPDASTFNFVYANNLEGFRTHEGHRWVDLWHGEADWDSTPRLDYTQVPWPRKMVRRIPLSPPELAAQRIYAEQTQQQTAEQRTLQQSGYQHPPSETSQGLLNPTLPPGSPPPEPIPTYVEPIIPPASDGGGYAVQ